MNGRDELRENTALSHPAIDSLLDVVARSTLDHHEVGIVTATSGRRFRVATDDGERWLARDRVYTRTHTRATLLCSRSHLEDYLLPS